MIGAAHRGRAVQDSVNPLHPILVDMRLLELVVRAENVGQRAALPELLIQSAVGAFFDLVLDQYDFDGGKR